jgi:hypothetical protein
VVVVRAERDSTTGEHLPPVEAISVGTSSSYPPPPGAQVRLLGASSAHVGVRDRKRATRGVAFACRRWARLGRAVSTLAYAQRMPG